MSKTKGCVAEVEWRHTLVDDVDEYEANARLIAAAPDLLEACIDAKQAMNNILEFGLFKEPQSERELLSFKTQLAQAIAKATGEA